MVRTLHTNKGTAIRRYRGDVGKQVGNSLYFHRAYWSGFLGTATWSRVLQIASQNDFEFSCVMTSPGRIRLDEAPGFDAERDPGPVAWKAIVSASGDPYDATTGTPRIEAGATGAVFHHKWLWVRDDYPGFDVEESFAWSRTWLETLTEPARGQSAQAWRDQLAEFGLE